MVGRGGLILGFARGVRRRAIYLSAAIAPGCWRLVRTPKILILTYHRVLPRTHPEIRTEQPGMYVLPETLEMHIQVLRKHFEIVHLDDWVTMARSGKTLPRLACALTFDDGWRDNYEFAYPVLLQHCAPAMVFLVSGLVGTRAAFWPERLRDLLLTVPLCKPLCGELGAALEGVRKRAAMKGSWTAEELDHGIRLAKSFDDREIVKFLELHGSPLAANDSRPLLNVAEVTEMVSSGLIRVGSHTRTHRRCSGIASDEELHDEIVNSADELSRLVGRAVEIFCYPNGTISPAAARLVRTRYIAAVGTERGWHDVRGNLHAMRRIGMHQDVSASQSAFLGRVSNWM